MYRMSAAMLRERCQSKLARLEAEAQEQEKIRKQKLLEQQQRRQARRRSGGLVTLFAASSSSDSDEDSDSDSGSGSHLSASFTSNAAANAARNRSTTAARGMISFLNDDGDDDPDDADGLQKQREQQSAAAATASSSSPRRRRRKQQQQRHDEKKQKKNKLDEINNSFNTIDGGSPGTVGLSEETFAEFVEDARRQANETTRRLTEAKIDAVAHLPRVARPAAYCASTLNPNFTFNLNDLHLQQNDSFGELMDASYTGIMNMSASGTGGGGRGGGMRQAEKSLTSFSLHDGGDGRGGRRRRSKDDQVKNHQQNRRSSSGDGSQKSKNTTQHQQQQRHEQAADQQEGAAQIRAAQSAAAVASEQQSKIIQWRNTPDDQLDMVPSCGFQRAEQAYGASPLQLGGAAAGAGAFASSSPSSSPFSVDHHQNSHQNQLSNVEKTIVGFANMSVDDVGFDAAVTALTAESQLVQRAGRSARWWEQQRQNELERIFRAAVDAAVQRGEKASAARAVKANALESLVPAALSAAQTMTLANEESRARWVIESDEREDRASFLSLNCTSFLF